MRRAVIDAALAIIDERGSFALSLREAARRAGVSSGAPYRHFADKAALLLAIAEEGNALLEAETAAELARLETDDPIEEFRARGIAYVSFAAAHPTYFRLMCSGELESEVPAVTDERESAERELVQLVGKAPALGDRAELIALAGRALAHGLARMIVDQQLKVPADREALRELTIRVLDVIGEGMAPPR